MREPNRLPSYVLGMCRMVVLDLRRGAGGRSTTSWAAWVTGMSLGEELPPFTDNPVATEFIKVFHERAAVPAP